MTDELKVGDLVRVRAPHLLWVWENELGMIVKVRNKDGASSAITVRFFEKEWTAECQWMPTEKGYRQETLYHDELVKVG